MNKKIVKIDSENVIDQLQKLSQNIIGYKTSYESVNLQIADRLPKIEDKINKNINSVTKLQEMISDSCTIGHESDAFLHFNQNLNKTIKTLDDNKSIELEAFKELKETIEQLNTTIKRIINVDEISEKLKVFAINSIVYAQQNGERGRGYQFISEEFVKLSEDLAKSTKTIKGVGKDLEEQSSSLLKILEDYNQHSIENNKYITDKYKTIQNNLEKDIKELYTSLDSCTSHLNNLKKPINNIMSMLQGQDIIHQQIDHIIKNIEESIEVLTQNSLLLNSPDKDSKEYVDIIALLNFLFITIEKQLKRTKTDLLKMIGRLEDPIKNIEETVNIVIKDRGLLDKNYKSLVSKIFSKPLDTIQKVSKRVETNQIKQNNIVFKLKEIEDLMLKQTQLSKKFAPQMEMIKNLLFLANVEQKRNQLRIDLDSSNSVFNESTFTELEEVIEKTGSSQQDLTKKIVTVVNIFNSQEVNIQKNRVGLNSSGDDLKKTEKVFYQDYEEYHRLTNELSSEIINYRELFAKLRELDNNLYEKINIFSSLKNIIINITEDKDILGDLNNNVFRGTVIQRVLDSLTVDEERVTILEEFPELDIEETTGSSITLF
ncbi:hypothetical protein EW093_07385 [Thiospirochaeta perfilievii]|uniref:Methyl-accepting transducer domain-containing protein n=1 Tax=Thiospirochaeta perfilievii TaxID=252967 RepID=A0A5C1QC91_9SPIO|nr:methyl-accepting chemotaxis protein [Thiospirochaeta perfilievii]QEN04529.1 hypothetical protein EW093_07385 [Thiospirochaeta perfilievii]